MIYLQDTTEIELHNSAVALGKFDGIHRGHMLLVNRLSELKEEGLTSVVCTIDMGKDSILSERERIEILEKAGVDYLVRFSFTREFAALTPKAFVQEILIRRFHVKDIVVGTDFQFGCNRTGNVDTLKKLAAEYQYHVSAIDKLKVEQAAVSSTRIRAALAAGDVSAANLLLGRNYTLTGVVLHGRHLGRTIGFPTANILPEEGKILPLCGVYASLVHAGGRIYRAVTNIGNNPTIDEKSCITIESYLLDFQGSLYGEVITVELTDFVRHEKKFDSVEILKKQLTNDISFVKRLEIF